MRTRPAFSQLGLLPLHRCCVTGNWDVAVKLLASGTVDVTHVDEVGVERGESGRGGSRKRHMWHHAFSCSQYGDSALHYACSCGHVTLVKLLLQYGANPMLVGEVRAGIVFKVPVCHFVASPSPLPCQDGFTPLDAALDAGHAAAAEVLRREQAVREGTLKPAPSAEQGETVRVHVRGCLCVCVCVCMLSMVVIVFCCRNKSSLRASCVWPVSLGT